MKKIFIAILLFLAITVSSFSNYTIFYFYNKNFSTIRNVDENSLKFTEKGLEFTYSNGKYGLISNLVPYIILEDW